MKAPVCQKRPPATAREGTTGEANKEPHGNGRHQ